VCATLEDNSGLYDHHWALSGGEVVSISHRSPTLPVCTVGNWRTEITEVARLHWKWTFSCEGAEFTYDPATQRMSAAVADDAHVLRYVVITFMLLGHCVPAPEIS
jgi:hypothetical protein